MDAGKIIIKTIIDNTGIGKGIKEAKKKLSDYKEKAEKNEAKVDTEKAQDTKKEEANIDKIITKVSKLVVAYGALRMAGKAMTFPVKTFTGIMSVTKDFGKALLGIGGKIFSIGKGIVSWGLQALGVKGIIEQIKGATNDVLSNNKQVADQVAIMQGALASALEPIISRIVNLVYTLFSFVNSIIKSITGKDLFASAQKNLNKSAKSAKELKKQLAGFDEMNVLSDNSSKGSGDSGVSLGTPDPQMLSFLDDLKKLFLDGDIGKIAQILSEKLVGALNYVADKIASIDFSGIGAKVSDFLTNIDFSGILVGLVRVFGEAVLGLQNFILAIDWGKLFANLSRGIIDGISKIGEYISKIKWGEIGAKLTEAFTSIDFGNIAGSLLQSLWNAILGLKDLILGIDFGEVASHLTDTLHDILNNIILIFQETDWGQIAGDLVDKVFDFVENVDWLKLGEDILLGICAGIEAIKDWLFGLWGRIFENVIEIVKNLFGISSPSKVFSEIGTFIVEGLINGIKSLVSAVVNVFKGIWTSIKNIFSVVGTWFKDKFKEAYNNIKTVFSGIKTFFSGIWDKIKEVFTKVGTKVGDAFSKSFKGIVNTVLGFLESVVNGAVKKLNTLIKGINKVGEFLHLGTIGELKELKIPRLAKGGIVNLPSRGVPVGSAIAGERGQEGIIPLTDSQQMELLGEAIGRYITINANITNTMNGRVISRELMKIQNENDFAYNR